MERIETAPAASGGGRPPTITAVGSPAEDDEPRSAADIASRSIRLTLGGRQFVVPVLFIAGNERWRAFETERTAAFNEMAAAANDLSQVAEALAAEPDLWLDLLYAYDTDCGRREGVLPPRDELRESIYEDEPQLALREVVRAANPKAAAHMDKLREAIEATSKSSPPTSGPRRRTAGRSKKSAPN